MLGGILVGVTLAVVALRASLDVREGSAWRRALARRLGEAGAVWLVIALLAGL